MGPEKRHQGQEKDHREDPRRYRAQKALRPGLEAEEPFGEVRRLAVEHLEEREDLAQEGQKVLRLSGRRRGGRGRLSLRQPFEAGGQAAQLAHQGLQDSLLVVGIGGRFEEGGGEVCMGGSKAALKGPQGEFPAELLGRDGLIAEVVDESRPPRVRLQPDLHSPDLQPRRESLERRSIGERRPRIRLEELTCQPVARMLGARQLGGTVESASGKAQGIGGRRGRRPKGTEEREGAIEGLAAGDLSQQETGGGRGLVAA